MGKQKPGDGSELEGVISKKPISEMSLEEIEKENAALELKMKRLNYEDLTYRLEQERGRRAHMALVHQNQQRSMDDFNREVILRQSWCKHKKGGKNQGGILNGNDSDYSVWHFQYPWGEIAVLCTRCGIEYRPSGPVMDALKLSDPAEFKRRLEKYKEALNWPTDNEPGGSQIFMIQHNTPEGKRAQSLN